MAQPVPAGLVRLRILNACNARFLTLSMATGTVRVIASDGGFLGSTVQTDDLVMSPGERYEILVDLRTSDSNSLMVGFDGGGEGFLGLLGGLFGGEANEMTALTLTRNGQAGFDGSMPDTLANLPPVNPDSATVTCSRAILETR